MEKQIEDNFKKVNNNYNLEENRKANEIMMRKLNRELMKVMDKIIGDTNKIFNVEQ